MEDRRDPAARERATDRGWRYWISVLYRDVWLLVITILVVVAVARSAAVAGDAKSASMTAKAAAQNAQAAVTGTRTSRAGAISEACNADAGLADAVRSILNDALSRSEQRDPVGTARARDFYEGVLAPLGGLKALTPKQRDRRCAARIARGLSGG